jgi:hypothetical protein
MRELGPEEKTTFRWNTLELLVHSCWIVGGCTLTFPFGAGLYFGENPETKGFWSSTIAAPVLSAPIFLIGAFLLFCYRRLQLTLDSNGISWTTVFRTHKLRWDEINFVAESPKYFSSLIIDAKTRRWTIPLTGIPGILPLRKLLHERQLEPPIELVLSQSQRWGFARFLLAFSAIILLIQVANGFQIIYWSPPFEKSHLRLLGTLSFIPTLLIIYSNSHHLPSLSTAVNVDGEQLVYRNSFRKSKTIPLSMITSIYYKKDANEQSRDLMIKTGDSEIKIPEQFPNLTSIAKELSHRTGLEVQDA